MYPTIENITANVNKTVTLVVVSDVKLRGGKSNPMQGHITKSSLVDVHILGNGEYEKVMKETVDSKFESKGRTWGTRRPDGLIEHKGELYVEVQIVEPIARVYFLDGEVIKKEEIIGLDEKARTEDVIVCTYKVNNIRSIIPGNEKVTEF